MIDEAVVIAKDVKQKTTKLKDFNQYLTTDPATLERCGDLKARVNDFASKFPIPGHEDH